MKSVLENMTEEQKMLLKLFREDLDPDLNSSHSDETLVKFLRAKQFDLKAAKKIFITHHYNKILGGVNYLVQTYVKPEPAEKFESSVTLGYAKDGTLIRYIAAGRLDFYGFIMSMSCFELCLYFSYMMEIDIETLRIESLRTGKHLSEVTYILDLEDFPIKSVLHKCVIEMGLDYIRLLQDCYPEIWGNVFVVNSPSIFKKAFEIFKGALRPTVLQKIRFADKGTTKDLLLNYIDADVLPAFLGGQRVDSNGDPMCREFIRFGGKIPHTLYSQNFREPLSIDDPEVRCVTIGPGSAFNLSFAIKEPESHIEFEGRTESGSVAISVFHKKFSPDPDSTEMPGEFECLDEDSENFEYTRVSVEIRAQMHCTQEKGTLFLPFPGIYVVRFSNAHSWFTSRKFYLKYRIISPNK